MENISRNLCVLPVRQEIPDSKTIAKLSLRSDTPHQIMEDGACPGNTRADAGPGRFLPELGPKVTFRRSDKPHVAERRRSIISHTAVGSSRKPEEISYLLDQRIGAGLPGNSRRRPLRPAHTVVGVVNLVRGITDILFCVSTEDPDLVRGR